MFLIFHLISSLSSAVVGAISGIIGILIAILYVIALTASKRFSAPSGYVKQEDLDNDMNIQETPKSKKRITKVGNYFEAKDLFDEFDEDSRLLSARTPGKQTNLPPRVITVDELFSK
jgi:hypothetical protein